MGIFCELFDIKAYLCAGVDGIINKIHLVAKKQGKFLRSDSDLGRLESDLVGLPLVVKGSTAKGKYDLDADEATSSTAVVHEVKRVGLLIDRYVDLEMRVGDHLVIYISKS